MFHRHFGRYSGNDLGGPPSIPDECPAAMRSIIEEVMRRGYGMTSAKFVPSGAMLKRRPRKIKHALALIMIAHSTFGIA
jgi:hypothetical protein